MRGWTLISSLFFVLALQAQGEDQKLLKTMRAFHQDLVQANTVSLNQQTDRALSYGHSNGWVETKSELIANLEKGLMRYNHYREDSVQVTVNGNLAHVRFLADIEAMLNGQKGQFRLRVLEVWVKKGNRWLLFARQAIRNG
jgi:uncharacterized lipoprotein YajG